MTLTAQQIADEAMRVSQQAGYVAEKIPPGSLAWSLEKFRDEFLKPLCLKVSGSKHWSTELPAYTDIKHGEAKAKGVQVSADLVTDTQGETWVSLQIIATEIPPQLDKKEPK